LAEACGRAESWSYPFELYAPIFLVAEDFDLPVYGLNISKAEPERIVVDELEPGSRAAAGIMAGDVIVSFGGREMKNSGDFHGAADMCVK